MAFLKWIWDFLCLIHPLKNVSCLPCSIHSTWPFKALTITLLADLFIQRQVQLLWEAFSLAAITARQTIRSHNPSLSLAGYSFIQLSELGQCGVNKKLPNSFEAARVGNRTWIIMTQTWTLNHSTTALHVLPIPLVTYCTTTLRRMQRLIIVINSWHALLLSFFWFEYN